MSKQDEHQDISGQDIFEMCRKGEPLWTPDMDRELVATEVRKVRDSSIGYLITSAQKIVGRALSERITPLGVSPAQWQVLTVMWARDGMVQKDLAEELVIEQATLTRTIDRMERDGLVKRRTDSEDRRRTRVFLTEKGFSMINILVPEAMTVLQQIMQGFSEQELEQFRSFIHRAIGNIDPDNPLSANNTSDKQGAAE